MKLHICLHVFALALLSIPFTCGAAWPTTWPGNRGRAPTGHAGPAGDPTVRLPAVPARSVRGRRPAQRATRRHQRRRVHRLPAVGRSCGQSWHRTRDCHLARGRLLPCHAVDLFAGRRDLRGARPWNCDCRVVSVPAATRFPGDVRQRNPDGDHPVAPCCLHRGQRAVLDPRAVGSFWQHGPRARIQRADDRRLRRHSNPARGERPGYQPVAVGGILVRR